MMGDGQQGGGTSTQGTGCPHAALARHRPPAVSHSPPPRDSGGGGAGPGTQPIRKHFTPQGSPKRLEEQQAGTCSQDHCHRSHFHGGFSHLALSKACVLSPGESHMR